MEGYLIWLAILAFLILILSLFQLQEGRYKKLQSNCSALQIEVQRWQDKNREKEMDLDRIKRDFAKLLKWRDRALELEMELKASKQTEDYASAKRMRYLEEYIASLGSTSSVQFLGTLPSKSLHTFEDKLNRMLEEAEFEVVILSPWIKRQMWDRVRGQLKRFTSKGGDLKVFMRGCESDYKLGLSDDISAEVAAIGGRSILVRQLHAKIYMVDRKEAIITSSNFTKGGVESNCEAGIYLNDPGTLRDISNFIYDIESLSGSDRSNEAKVTREMAG
jgi:PLD-like domain